MKPLDNETDLGFHSNGINQHCIEQSIVESMTLTDGLKDHFTNNIEAVL